MSNSQHIGEVIEERMLELGLTRRDLEPIIGSRSKVSEVISGERDITMPMARALYKHLSIPAEVLLQERPEPATGGDLDYKRFPLREMSNKGWIDDESGETPEEMIEGLKERAGDDATTLLTRKNDLKRANAKINPYALLAWQWQVQAQAAKLKDLPRYEKGCITREAMLKVARMSPVSSGPLDAIEYLQRECGIAVVYVPHLSRTYLDAATLLTSERPIVGITLRYDRLDSFWYTLEHELAHINKHSGLKIKVFIDDNTMRLENTDDNKIEFEADTDARNALIPDELWEERELGTTSTPLDVMEFASEIGVHPAIVAGRIRYETGNYRRLSQMVGSKKVRRLFKIV